MFKNKLLNGVVLNKNICFVTPGDEPSFEEILQFDPFDQQSSGDGAGEGDNQDSGQQSAQGSGDDQGAQSGEETEGAGDEQQQPGGTTPPPAGQAAGPARPAPTTPPTQMSQADLTQLIARQTEAITGALRAQPAQQRQQDQPTPNKFNLGVPDALATALRSEDPAEFRNGVGAMINGVANHVWNAMMEHLEQTVAPQISRGVEGYVQSVRQQEEVARDFYGTYPQLQIPELAPVVQAIGVQIAREYSQAGKPLGWSQNLRDDIANRIFERMPFLKDIQPRQQQQQRRQGNGQQRRSFATGSGARPANNGGETEEQRDMTAMIFGPR